MKNSVIEVTDLHKRYGSKVAVDNVSFTVDSGEIFGILGPNGAGKTTTVECISGLRRPDGGTISVLGKKPGDKDLHQRLGVQLQESTLQDNLTVAEILDLYASFYPSPADWNALMEQLGMTEHRDVRFGKLSGGQKQRLSIALALVGNPRIAILDELTTGLDPQARRDTWELIEGVRESGVTIVLVTHFMEEAQRLCDRLAVIDAGRVVALNTPAGLATQVSAQHRLSFRPSEPVDIEALKALPEVAEVHLNGGHMTVAGTENVVQAVMSLLARNHIVAGELRVAQATLDDAFVALTGHSVEK
jgi:ABC-2 type transport system ATP-binding protein